MENPLAHYINKNNLKGAIAELNVVQGTAKDSGNIYYCLEIKLINGFSHRLFLRDAQSFGWCNAFDMIDTDDMINNL